MTSIPGSNANRGCIHTLPRYLHPHLILPAKGQSRHQPSNPRATKSLGQLPNSNACATPTRENSVCPTVVPFSPDFSLFISSQSSQAVVSASRTARGSSSIPCRILFPDTSIRIPRGQWFHQDTSRGCLQPSPSLLSFSTALTPSPTFPASTFHRSIYPLSTPLSRVSPAHMVAHSPFTILHDGQIVRNTTANVNLLNTSVEAGPSDIDCTFRPFVKTVVSFLCFAGWETSPEPAFPKRLFIQLTHCFLPDPTSYSIIHNIWTDRGGIQRPRTGFSNSPGRVWGFVPQVFPTPRPSCPPSTR